MFQAWEAHGSCNIDGRCGRSRQPGEQEAERMQVTRVGVIGAGVMGRGIAQVAAQGGYDTLLQDIDAEQLARARDAIRSGLAQGVERGALVASEAEGALSRLRTSTELAAAAAAELVIEAAPERIDLKLHILGELDRLCTPETILASNTSSLSITEMAA